MVKPEFFFIATIPTHRLTNNPKLDYRAQDQYFDYR